MASRTEAAWRPIDIAGAYGISRQRVNGWTKHPDFPDPIPGLPVRVWREADVRAFVDQHHPDLGGAA